MLKFHETPCAKLFCRTFELEENHRVIGGAALVYHSGERYETCYVEVTDWQLNEDKKQFEDLLAGAVLNAACNTEVALVRVPKGGQWSRFGLEDKGLYLEQEREKIIFDSVCSSRGNCGDCTENCAERGTKQ